MDSSEHEHVFMSVSAGSPAARMYSFLLTFTVYSWLWSEPGALQSRVASPSHRFRTPTTRGLTFYVEEWEVEGERSAASYGAVFIASAFSAIFFSFLKYSSVCTHRALRALSPLSFDLTFF